MTLSRYPKLDLSRSVGWQKPLAALHFLPSAVGAIRKKTIRPANTFHFVDREEIPIGLSAGDISYVASERDIATLAKLIVEFEDRRFFSHSGVDLIAVGRAMISNLRAGRIVQGGSTITQQLVRNTLLTPDRSLTRKALEIVLALLLERRYSKAEILCLYSNLVFLGPGVRGFQAASRLLYRRSVAGLDVRSLCGLVGLLRQPSRLYPVPDPGRFMQRQAILMQLHVNRSAARGAPLESDCPVRIPNPVSPRKLLKPRFTHVAVRMATQSEFGVEDISRIGLTVERALQARTDRLLCHISRTHDVERVAAVVLDNRRGEVLAESAWEDGRDCEFSPTFTGGLQPGSTLKPFAVLAALEEGYPSDLELISAPFRSTCTSNRDGSRWRVRNYAHQYRGKVTLAEATHFSDNTAFARLAEMIPAATLESVYRRFGLCGPSTPTPAIVLGAVDEGVSLLQLAAAYSAIARNGIYLAPRFIRFVQHTDRSIWRPHTPAAPAIVATYAAVTSLKLILSTALPTLRPLGFSGKTGTTSRGSLVGVYDDAVSIAVWLGHRNARDESASKGWSALRTVERLIAEIFLGHGRNQFTI